VNPSSPPTRRAGLAAPAASARQAAEDLFAGRVTTASTGLNVALRQFRPKAALRDYRGGEPAPAVPRSSGSDCPRT
jgi:hypothetical protein